MSQKTIAIGLSLLLLLSGVSAFAGPKIQLSEQTFDFGYVPQLSRISHVFMVNSVGNDTLKILKVIPGCGCTKAPIAKNDLAVGESTELEIIFDTKQYTKQIVKAPRIMTNESPDPTQLTFNAYVVTSFDSLYPLTISPSRIVPDSPSDNRTSFDFVIQNVSDQPLTIKMIDAPKEFFSIELPSTIAANSSVKGNLTFKHEAAIDKQLEKSFTIEVNDEKHSRFTVPVILPVKMLGSK